ncbi:MAG TPA: hypothetical protein VJ742_12555 [Nitrososphaera sp.]|nr:hypothetical protein [Nitrososphaera sp.]
MARDGQSFGLMGRLRIRPRTIKPMTVAAITIKSAIETFLKWEAKRGELNGKSEEVGRSKLASRLGRAVQAGAG